MFAEQYSVGTENKNQNKLALNIWWNQPITWKRSQYKQTLGEQNFQIMAVKLFILTWK